MLIHENTQENFSSRVVVIGANGVVGKKLVVSLKSKGIDTLALSRQECDLLSEQSISFFSDIFKPEDHVIFLAAITPDKGRGIQAYIDNLQIAKHISYALENSLISQFILLSSEAIYPTTDDLISEHTSLAPMDLYGSMHLAREICFKNLNLPLAIIRTTLIYGEGDTHNSYGPNRFIKEALEHSTITLFGKGEEKRSHIFVEDVIHFVEKVIYQKSVGTINLCPTPTISFSEIAGIVKEHMPKNIEIIHKPQISAITHRYFDNHDLYRAFPDFVFENIESGIKKIVEGKVK